MFILSIDPGITTGYALIEDGTLKESGNILYEDLEDSILAFYRDQQDLAVVIEETPTPTMSRLDKSLKEVVGWMYQSFPSAVWISPGVWKQNRSIINLSIPILSPEFGTPSPHQKDAYRLGMYFLIIYLANNPQVVP